MNCGHTRGSDVSWGNEATLARGLCFVLTSGMRLGFSLLGGDGSRGDVSWTSSSRKKLSFEPASEVLL